MHAVALICSHHIFVAIKNIALTHLSWRSTKHLSQWFVLIRKTAVLDVGMTSVCCHVFTVVFKCSCDRKSTFKHEHACSCIMSIAYKKLQMIL